MDLQRINQHTSAFNEITHFIEGDNGKEKVEVWFARELQPVLGYARWENFTVAIGRAAESCKSQDISIDDHFREVTKMVTLGSGSKREVKDYMLTRFACYLIAQNGDPRKPQIAFAQTYFAVQTRRAELIEKRRMGVPEKLPLADFLPTISIKAKDFAAEMTSVNVQTKDLQGEACISQEHIANNAAVRDMLVQRGIVPENLPAAEDVKKVERRLASEQKKALENKK